MKHIYFILSKREGKVLY